MPVPLKNFGRDHWSLLAYLETRCVDHGGTIDRRHMRVDADLHPQFVHLADAFRHKKYPTRLRGGTILQNHDDYSCLLDLEAAGLVEALTGLAQAVRMTAEGSRLAGLVREHRTRAGSFDTFNPGETPRPCRKESTSARGPSATGPASTS